MVMITGELKSDQKPDATERDLYIQSTVGRQKKLKKYGIVKAPKNMGEIQNSQEQ